MRLYVDQDGVLADFDQGVEDHYGEPYSAVNKDRFWNETCEQESIFYKLPVIEEGRTMLNEFILAGFRPTILTSTGGGRHHYNIAWQKLDWIRDNILNRVPVAFCMGTKNKADFASPGDILIDDRQKVIDAWEEAGGYGILFTREAASAITGLVKGTFNRERTNTTS